MEDMHTDSELSQSYLTYKNLYKGLKKSCRNVRWKTSVTAYELNGLKNTAKLINDFKNGTYQISEYQEFVITEPKERKIVATRLRDRQVQRSMCDSELYDDITRHFIYDNAACQVGKGTVFAMNRMKKHLEHFSRTHPDGSCYYLKCDIHHFFEQTTHSLAKDAIHKRVPNLYLQNRVDQIIDSFEGDSGIGLGSQVSQLIELSVLDDMDHMIKETLQVENYIRYMDDFILIHESKDYLRHCLSVIRRFLNSINLSLNNKTQIQSLRHGIAFLNWHFKIKAPGSVVAIPDRKRVYAKCRKLKKLIALCHEGKISREVVLQSYNGMISHLQWGNSYKSIRKLRKTIEAL